MDGRSKSRRRIRSEKYVQDIPPLHDAAQRVTKVDDQASEEGSTLLHIAAKTGEGVLQIIKGGASVNSENDKGQSPLHLAAKHGQLQAILHLIKNEAEVNKADHEGNIALHYAAERGTAGIKQLIRGGAIVNWPNN